jgi:sulfoxide reductase heme-binding subunit YedZ
MRRDIGIAGGVAALVHTLLGLQVHMGGALSKYFLLPPDPDATAYAFVGTNWIGLISALLLLGLVTISNNISIRMIGLDRWKKIQRLAYLAVVAAFAHGILYQLLEKREGLVIALVIATTVVVASLQAAGWRRAIQR